MCRRPVGQWGGWAAGRCRSLPGGGTALLMPERCLGGAGEACRRQEAGQGSRPRQRAPSAEAPGQVNLTRGPGRHAGLDHAGAALSGRSCGERPSTGCSQGRRALHDMKNGGTERTGPVPDDRAWPVARPGLRRHGRRSRGSRARSTLLWNGPWACMRTRPSTGGPQPTAGRSAGAGRSVTSGVTP